MFYLIDVSLPAVVMSLISFVIISSDKAFLVLGLSSVMLATPSSTLTDDSHLIPGSEVWQRLPVFESDNRGLDNIIWNLKWTEYNSLWVSLVIMWVYLQTLIQTSSETIF